MLSSHRDQSLWRFSRDAPRRTREDPGEFTRPSAPVWLFRRAGAHWRGCLRLPVCLSDSTFVNDNIRCQHSPPQMANHATGSCAPRLHRGSGKVSARIAFLVALNRS